MLRRILIALLALLLAVPAQAEGIRVMVRNPQEAAETEAAHDAPLLSLRDKVFAYADADYVDLGTLYVDFDELTAYLDQFPNLTKVDMFGIPVWSSTIKKLLERYPGVQFGWSIRMAEHTIRTDQTAFSTLHYSNSETHGDAIFEPLKYCTELRALDIGHNGVTDLSFLYEMPELRVLIIACNHQVTDLTPIASLKHLEYLEIFSDKVHDLSPLVGLEHLVDLNIGYNYIEDYTVLYQMPQLQRLWLKNSNNYNDADPVPQSVIDGLREHLPNTQLDWKNNPSEGGWREHPHFDVIHRMFRTGIYEPFEDSAP